MIDEAAAGSRSEQSPWMSNPIVELRQYTLLPGQRDVLIDIFERNFIEGQEAVGMEVIDHFRDLDDPDRFVWLRGFPDMPERARATTAFYDGAVWQENRDAANATLVDHENVLLLRPASPTAGNPIDHHLPAVAPEVPACLVVATIYHLVPSREDEFPAFFARAVAPALTGAGATILAAYATEHSPNNYPRLAIREGEHVFVWVASFADGEAYERHLAALARSPGWRDNIITELAHRTEGSQEVLRLEPTARSRTRA
ncbi:MAG: NIPSNAP family protein [Chloroflexota bacterium]|nr:NIPSNAP family protein [Chloroflexota bacterium]